MAFAKIHEAVHVCSLVGEQKYVQRFFDRLFLPAKKAEIETVRNGKCDECCVQQKDSDMHEKNYDLCDVHIF